jgi:hypothetical protein
MVRHDEESQPLMTDPERRDSESLSDAEAGPVPSKGPTATTRAIDSGHPDAPIEVGTSSGSSRQHNDQLEVIDHDHAAAAAASGENNSGRSTPRFMQDERAWKRWRWVPYPVRRVWKTVVRWSYGPTTPKRYRIRPLFPVVQEYPLVLAERFLPRRRAHRAWLLLLYFAVWLVTFVLLKRYETVASYIEGWGSPQNIKCGTTYWGSGNACGVDGTDCRPFNNSGFPFRCAANCESYHVLNPRAVGDQEVIYQPFVVGGPSSNDGDAIATYRGDSFVCGAGIHAGVISNEDGGCGVVRLVGQGQDFVGSDRNGIPTVGFDSYFPLAFQFIPDVKCTSKDMRWSILGLSATFTGVLSLFTASPALFFFPCFIAIFWTTGMALDSPAYSTVAALFSDILGKFLPTMFVAWVMYDKMGIRRTLDKLTAQFEKTILWLGPCWVGAMDNYTLSFIPIQRLTGHDLEQQPGAKAALAIIVVVLVGIIATQVYFFQQEGRFRKYITLYAVFILTIVIFLTLPGLNLRIHHYILALLLLPGTSLQTRPSLIYQGLLIGLFINGAARWGFDSVLQTPGALQGDAQKGTELPVINAPDINWAGDGGGLSNITISWQPPKGDGIDGISILVNDVERFRSYFEDAINHEENFEWSRESDLDRPEYFRFAFMQGSSAGDYTKAGTWTADGEWQQMEEGPSKVKGRSTGEDELMVRR